MNLLTDEQSVERFRDHTGNTRTITRVEIEGDRVSILADSMSFSTSKFGDIVPEVGQEITVYGGLGQTIRGIDLDGRPVYYMTDAELEEERQQTKDKIQANRIERYADVRDKLDADYVRLPPEFRRRIDWFRSHCATFRWEFEEYEMSVCIDACHIFKWAGENPEKIRAFAKLEWGQQSKEIPELYDGHSGNSFSAAVDLAVLYCRDPLLVVAQHAAISPLVGCGSCGCHHPREQDVLDAVEAASNA